MYTLKPIFTLISAQQEDFSALLCLWDGHLDWWTQQILKDLKLHLF